MLFFGNRYILKIVRIFFSAFSIFVPWSRPLRCKRPCMKRYPIKFVYERPNRGASERAFFRSRKISPSFLSRGKDKIFVELSFPRYVRLSSRDFRELMITREPSYSAPRTTSAILTKGKRGSLPFVVFLIERDMRWGTSGTSLGQEERKESSN